jgi:hypothetical protein
MVQAFWIVVKERGMVLLEQLIIVLLGMVLPRVWWKLYRGKVKRWWKRNKDHLPRVPQNTLCNREESRDRTPTRLEDQVACLTAGKGKSVVWFKVMPDAHCRMLWVGPRSNRRVYTNLQSKKV